MKTKILYLFTRTPLHVGAGSSVGAIDAPVHRERHTRFPIIPGSSIKGVMADLFHDQTEMIDEKGKFKRMRKKESELTQIFGSDDDKAASVGALRFGEARLLAFPVRSAKNSFAWITCPLILERYKRSINAAWEVPVPASDTDCMAVSEVKLGNAVVLDTYKLNVTGAVSKDVLDALAAVHADDPVWKSVRNRLVVVHDEMASFFAEQSCEVVTRIKVDDDKGTVAQGALFNQEQVPSESMMYVELHASEDNAFGVLGRRLAKQGNVIQIGGDATTGLGYCSVRMDGGI